LTRTIFRSSAVRQKSSATSDSTVPRQRRGKTNAEKCWWVWDSCVGRMRNVSSRRVRQMPWSKIIKTWTRSAGSR